MARSRRSRVPASADPFADPAPRPASPPPGTGNDVVAVPAEAGAYVLIVEDEPVVADIVAATLSRGGYRTQTLASCAGLARCLADDPSLVMLDVSLAATDAIEVIKALADRGYRGNVVLVSAAAPALLEDVRRVGRRRGLTMLPALRKPFAPSDVLAAAARGVATCAVRAEDGPPRGDAWPAVDCAQALREGWMEVWFQPKCDLASGRVTGAECLARLRHPTEGLMLPAHFLPGITPAALDDLAAFTIRECYDAWLRIAASHGPMRLAVNVSAETLIRLPIVGLLRELKVGDAPGWPGLTFEITEEDAIRNVDAVHEAATQLVVHGNEISIDDFGTGYSNFARLDALPCHEIKIDKSFIEGFDRSPLKTSISRAIIEVGRARGLRIVAEGVGTAAELRHLRELGCDEVQGYLVGKPMPREDFLDRLGRSGSLLGGCA